MDKSFKTHLTLKNLVFIAVVCFAFPPICSQFEYCGGNVHDVPRKRTMVSEATMMLNGSEVNAANNPSPTRVVRAIAAEAQNWRINCLVIYTEPRFVTIAEEWRTKLLRYEYICRVDVINLKNASMLENALQWSNPGYCLSRITIVMLNGRKLKLLFATNRHYSQHRTSNHYVVVGKCPYFLRWLQLRDNVRVMLFNLDTSQWIHGFTKKCDVTLHTMHRKNQTAWIALPYKSITKHKSLEDKHHKLLNHNYYGYLENIRIYSYMYDEGMAPFILQARNNEMTGIVGRLAEYMKQYLKFTLCSESIEGTVGTNMILEKILNYEFDFHIGIFLIDHNDQHKYLPPFIHDGMTIFSRKIEHPMTFKSLFSILQPNVWIIIIAMLFGFNFCLFFTYGAYDEYPSITNHCCTKTTMTKMSSILFFGTLITAPMECDEACNKSSRWILVSLNFLLFIMTATYLAIFFVVSLADKHIVPFVPNSNILQETNCLAVSHGITENMYLSHSDIFDSMKRFKNLKAIRRFENIDDVFRAVSNGNCIVNYPILLGTSIFGSHPQISKSFSPTCYMPASLGTSHTFPFTDLFSRIVLQLKEVGIINGLRKRYMPSETQFNVRQSRRVLNFFESWFTFAAVGIGISASILVLALELLASKCNIM